MYYPAFQAIVADVQARGIDAKLCPSEGTVGTNLARFQPFEHHILDMFIVER